MFVWIVVYSKKLWLYIERNKIAAGLVAISSLIVGGFFTEVGGDVWKGTRESIVGIWQSPRLLDEALAQNAILNEKVSRLERDKEELSIELSDSLSRVQPYTSATFVPFVTVEQCVAEIFELARRRGYIVSNKQHDGESVRFSVRSYNYEVRCLVRAGNRLTYINVASNSEEGVDHISSIIHSEVGQKFWMAISYEKLPRSFPEQHMQLVNLSYPLATDEGEMALGIKLPDRTRAYFEEKGGIIDCTYGSFSDETKLCGVEFPGMFAVINVWRSVDNGLVHATVNAVIDYLGDRYLWTPDAARDFFLRGP